MKNIIIGENDVGRRIDNFLLMYFRKIPRSLMYKLIRKKKIKVNNKKIKENQRLYLGDSVTLYLSSELLDNVTSSSDFMRVSSNLDILYEDENVLIINKKIGTVCQPDRDNLVDCVVNRVKKYLFDKGEYKFEDENVFAPSLVNRIDRNTEGIVIASKNFESLRFLNEKIKNKEIKKYYKCLVLGKMPKKQDLITSFLYKDYIQNKSYISDEKIKNSKLIQTKYKVIEFKNNLSLLEIELLTGRSHQIRAHLAHIGHPIVGDGKYGFSKNSQKIKNQLLVSYKIKFEFKNEIPSMEYLNGKEFEINNSYILEQISKIMR